MKKESAAWYIAATHYLTAGFAIPFLAIVILGFTLISLGIDMEPIAIQIGMDLVWLLSIWLGVIYSSRYLQKKYVVTDAKKIVTLSTIYRIVIITLGFAGTLLTSLNNPDTVLNPPVVTYNIIASVIGTIVFYIASKKYVKQDILTVAGS